MDRTGSNLSNQTKFSLNRIYKLKTNLTQKFKKEKQWVKNLVIATFAYFPKTLIVLSATSEGVFIISFTTVTGATAGIASAIFTLVFSLATGITKKLLSIARNKNKKHNKILVQ